MFRRRYILTMQFAPSTMPLRIRNTRRKMPPRVFENHPLNNGGGYEVLTYLRQSWIRTFPDAGRAPVKLRVPAHSKSTSIDQPSASRKLVERVFSFRERPYERRRRVPPLKISSPTFFPTHTRPQKCARKLGQARTGSDFSSGITGVAPNMALECVGGILSDWRNVEANVSQEFRNFQGFPDRAFVF